MQWNSRTHGLISKLPAQHDLNVNPRLTSAHVTQEPYSSGELFKFLSPSRRLKVVRWKSDQMRVPLAVMISIHLLGNGSSSAFQEGLPSCNCSKGERITLQSPLGKANQVLCLLTGDRLVRRNITQNFDRAEFKGLF